MKKEISYFQYQKELDYPVFVRLEDQGFEYKVEGILSSMGFSKLEEEEFKRIEIINNETRILNLGDASMKAARQIDQAGAFDAYGPESVTEFGSYDVYRYKGVGMTLMGHSSTMWEGAVKNIEANISETKALITRYLSHALAPFGVVSFWGVPVDEGFVVMKPKEANFESVFVDIENNCFMTQDGIKDIDFGTQILRLDDSLKGKIRAMKKEELVSFLSTKTCFLSPKGLDFRLKATVFELSSMVEGYIYPAQNFKPRASAA